MLAKVLYLTRMIFYSVYLISKKGGRGLDS